MPVADNMSEYASAAQLSSIPVLIAHSTWPLQTLFALDAKLPHASIGCGAGVGGGASVGDAGDVVKVLVDAVV